MGRQRRGGIVEAIRRCQADGYCFRASTPSERRSCQRGLWAGSLAEPCRGMFVEAGWWERKDGRAQAECVLRSVAQAHPMWVFGLYSAALVYGLEVPFRCLERACVVDVKRRRIDSSSDVRRVMSTEAPVVRYRGLTITSIEETIVACACDATLLNSLGIIDSAMRKGLTSRDHLERYMADRCRGRRGIRAARRAVAHADGRSENGGESFARAQIIELGFQAPQLQIPLEDPLRPGHFLRADFGWNLGDDLRLKDDSILGELDGQRKYTDSEMTGSNGIEGALLYERKRESRLSIYRKPIVRFSYADAADPDRFARLLGAFGVPRAH